MCVLNGESTSVFDLMNSVFHCYHTGRCLGVCNTKQHNDYSLARQTVCLLECYV